MISPICFFFFHKRTLQDTQDLNQMSRTVTPEWSTCMELTIFLVSSALMTQTTAIRAHRCLVHQRPSPSLVSCATPAPLPPQTGKGMGEGARRGFPGLAEATRHSPICHCLHTCLSVVTQHTPCSLAASVMHACKKASAEAPNMGNLSLSL